MCGQSFEEQFIQLYESKGFQSCYEISQLSKGELKEDYLSHLVNDPIWRPGQNKLEKLAEVFAQKTYLKKYRLPINEEKMKRVCEDELRELQNFFEKARKEIKQDIPDSPVNSKKITWQITLEMQSNDPSVIYRILGKLEKLGKGIISVKEIKQGSIILILESSPEVFERIQSLYQAGQLSELLNVPILDLQVLPNEERVNLSQWFENVFTAGWQSVEELLTPQQLSPTVWSDRVKQAKLFNLRADLISHAVNLVINLTRASEDRISIWLQVYPSGEDYLPLNLKLLVLAEGKVFKEVTARSADVLIQCQFDADPGDEFTVKLALGEVSVTEIFVL
ncbi:DUF1822 family protein [Microcoleus sp. LEGE 07076]|uniref:DUF1822 family protein n=1 Tax=Microcoleus sp. LEGE 07076 TaxID=915322 RepID=UPI00188188AB|nr:DUF1822 family protein [Microcoleus sp. LEGE 07076]MBE9187438.1 DUF1822 family protein [Microcoleus sp. LEGE 07076]